MEDFMCFDDIPTKSVTQNQEEPWGDPLSPSPTSNRHWVFSLKKGEQFCIRISDWDEDQTAKTGKLADTIHWVKLHHKIFRSTGFQQINSAVEEALYFRLLSLCGQGGGVVQVIKGCVNNALLTRWKRGEDVLLASLVKLEQYQLCFLQTRGEEIRFHNIRGEERQINTSSPPVIKNPGTKTEKGNREEDQKSATSDVKRAQDESFFDYEAKGYKNIPKELKERWIKDYKTLNVENEIISATNWLIAENNPKHIGGATFLVNWLNRSLKWQNENRMNEGGDDD